MRSNYRQPKVLVKRFRKSHVDQMRAIFKSRNLDPVDFIPKIGAIAFVSNRPVAFAFVRKCEGNAGIWDGMATHAAEPPEIRDQALRALTNRILKILEKTNMHTLIAWSVDKHTIERGQHLGFEVLEAKLMAKKLKE